MKIKKYHRPTVTLILSLLIITVGANNARGNSTIVEFKLSAGIHAAASAEFGHSIDINGDVAVVGSPVGEAAYVFSYNGTDWDLEARLIEPASSTIYFGWDVAISGNTLVVSAFNFLWSYGSVYVFTHDGDSWDEGQELISGSGVGASVAIDGDTILVGATGVGLIHVFTNHNDGKGWQQEIEFISPPSPAPFFGWALDLSGNTAVVGAPLMGLAYVFTRDGDSWDEGQELIRGDWVGSSVAIDGETLVVGAPSLLPISSQIPQGPGSAYVFRKDGNGTWQQQELPNPGVDGFGAAVAISGHRLAVGAPTDDVACSDDPFCNSGSVQMFYYDGESWIQNPQHAALIPTLEPAPEESDQFGWAVAMDGSRIAVGARFGDVFAGNPPDAPIISDAGAAYVFALPQANRPPKAKAKADPDEAIEGYLVVLDGSLSEDPDGDPLTYEWVQKQMDDEPLVELNLNNPVYPTFIAPELNLECTTLRFELRVTDDKGLTSEPQANVDVKVLPNNLIYSELRRKHRQWLTWHKYTFKGFKDEVVTISLEADPNGWNHGKGVTLILKDKIRGIWFREAARGDLPKTITAKLPADGEYAVYVVKQPLFYRGKPFSGKYVLTMEGTCGKLRKSSR